MATYGGDSDFDLGSMYMPQGGGTDMSGASAATLAGSDASAYSGDQYKRREGIPDGLQFQSLTDPSQLAAMYSMFGGPSYWAQQGYTGNNPLQQEHDYVTGDVKDADPSQWLNFLQNQGYGYNYATDPDNFRFGQLTQNGKPVEGVATEKWSRPNNDFFNATRAITLAGLMYGGAVAGGAGGGTTAGATSAEGAGAAGAGAGASYAPATNSVLADSAMNSAGYGASSAGAGLNAGAGGFSLSALGQRAGKGALLNGGMTAAQGGDMNDILKSAGYGALGGSLSYGVDTYNPGGYVTDNPDWQKVVNRGVSGAAGSAASGGNPLVGAAWGSGQQAGNVLGGNLWNSFGNNASGSASMPDYSLGDMGGESSTPVKDWFANNNQQSAAPIGYTQSPEVSSALGNNTESSLYNPDFNATASAPAESNSNPFKQLIAAASGALGGSGKAGSPQFGDMAGSLMGLYSAYQQKKRMAQLRGGLESMFGPNSPYAQQLGQQLARRDAAAGRRSQYGPREVELQARLAEMNSRNAPTIQNLLTGEQQARDRGLGSILRFGQQSGINNQIGGWLQNMYQNYNNGGWGSGSQYGNQDLGQYF